MESRLMQRLPFHSAAAICFFPARQFRHFYRLGVDESSTRSVIEVVKTNR